MKRYFVDLKKTLRFDGLSFSAYIALLIGQAPNSEKYDVKYLSFGGRYFTEV